MHLECPHCQAEYDIDSDISDVVCVCQRCGSEFDVQSQAVAGEDPELKMQPANQQVSENQWVHDVESDTDMAVAPQRKSIRLWPWFLTMLVLLTGVGFQVQKDVWMDNRWFRSTLINIGFELQMRAKDWRIVPESVRPKWIKRNDGSRVLFVRGRIENLLGSDMHLPRINIIFFSKIVQKKQIGQLEAVIRRIPSEQALHQFPMALPAMDSALVPALGEHDFAVVVESVPQETGDFSLMPALP